MRVELKLAREVPVAEDAKAVIVAQSLVSARFVQLTPAVTDGADDFIYFGMINAGLFRVPASGGTPAAAHEIPAGMKMGASLPLETPQRQRAEPREDGMPENFEKPRGRMLIFWGCGEQAGAGQPYVVDFSKLAQGDVPQGLISRRGCLMVTYHDEYGEVSRNTTRPEMLAA